ncbi:glutathione S-transferase family protein [Pusillimonas caeni]|uniref:glutathione S-transferase family protein n=1 Tax=Pusillimonas caeni TaxID=1348472 RepID=UPI000E599E3A|nr:glutathione S-transferase family protein [Pusillimonas caeni]TFL10018.1 glutathione S-transferase family protein [Pusillimonas caeni]
MKLYYLPGACPLVSQIVMEWMGLSYELEAVERDALKKPEFLKLNPVGSVPVLVDGDLVLTQSVAILEYLNELHPEAGLHGADVVERAEVRRWLSFANADLHRTFAMIFGVQAYSSDAEIQKLLIDKTSERLRFLFGIADKQLEGKDWLTGKRSIADPYLYVVSRWARAKEVDLSGMDNLKRFFERVDADPAVQTALKKQGLA